MKGIALVFWVSVVAQTAQLFYDEPVIADSDSVFEFFPKGTVSTVTVSSDQPVLILLRKDKIPSSNEFDQKSFDYLVLSDLDLQGKYFLSLHPKTSFTLLLESPYISNLNDSLPVTGYAEEASHHLFYFQTINSKDVRVSLVYFAGKAELVVMDLGFNKSFHVENWEFGKVAKVGAGSYSKLRVSVIGLMNTDYTLTVDSGNEIWIKNGEISGLVEEHDLEYFTFTVDQSLALRIKLSVFSGECDMYLSVGNRPSIQQHHWAFDEHGSKIVELSPIEQSVHPGSQYILAIHGITSSAFVLSIQNSKTPIHRLSSGFPSIGSVPSNTFEYFSILLKEDQEVSVLLSAGSGNPDLYGKFCNSSSSPCEFSLSDVKTPTSSIFYSNNTFGLEEIHSKGKGELIIGVFGASDLLSDFTIVAVLDDSEILLRSGTPQSSTMTEKGYRYYKYKLAKWSASSVQFLLTPISGNPDLYVSRSAKPSIEEYDASSVNSGLEVDSITFTKGKDYESLNGTYFISVYSDGPSQFSIVAKENHPGGNTTVQLYPGLPQKDTFYSHCMKHRLYFFPIKFTEETKKPIRVSLTAITGKFLLAVTNSISHIDHERRIFYYHWSSDLGNNQTANTIKIQTTDKFYLVKSTYAILVNTLEFGSDSTATYSIVLRIGDDLVLLTDNSPIVDLVEAEKYNFYTFPITLSREDVHVKMTAFSGNPEIYIALNHTSPNNSNYQFMAKGQNNYKIKLEWLSLKEKCPKLPDSYHHGNSTYCSLYIGVTSKSESSYSISVHANQLNYQLLLIPSTTLSVLSSENRFYYSFPNITSDILIDCQLSIGEASLYVKLMSSVFQDISDVKFPTSEDNHFTSQVYFIHSRRVKITHSDFSRLCGPKCLLALTVTCGLEPCEFSLSLTQDNVVALIEGENFLGSVSKDSYVYFSYFCGREDQDFIISVTALDSGNPDIYVKKTNNEMPSKTDWHWKAQTWEGEALVVSRNDLYFNETNTIKGTYVVAVYGKTASSFQIRVRQNPQIITKLISGLPEHQVLNTSEYAYFYYKSSISSDIIIQVIPYSGRAVIYGKTNDPLLSELYESLPSSSDYQFSSLSGISQFSMIISQDSPNFCTSCNILIAVQCTTDCRFSITASHRQKISLLPNGVPIRGELEKNSWNYYYFEVSTLSDLDFSLTTFSGDADLFINTSPEVSFSDFKWSSITIKSYEHLIISRDDENYIKGGYYVGVFSNLQSSYAITAHIKSSVVQLISGLPSYYSLSPSSYMYFVFEQRSVVAQNMQCVLSPSELQKPLVYVKASKELVYPGPEVHDSMFSGVDYKDLYQGLYFKVKLEAENNLYISVVAGSESLNNFTIICSGKDDATVLKMNKEMFDQIESHSDTKMYEVNVEKKGSLAVFIIPCFGPPLELRISSNWTMERKEQPEFIVNRMTDGQLVAVVTNALGRYYIEVTRQVKSQNSFVITTYYSHSDEREIVVPGNYGKIEIDKSDDGVLLEWEPPGYENLTSYNDEVSYQVYKLDSQDHLSACSIMMSRDSGNSSLIQETTKTKYLFKGKKKSYINIIAVLPSSAKTFRFLPYDAVQVTPTKKTSTSIWIWLMLVVIIFIALILFLISRKTRKIKQRIDIEMTVGRNIPGKGQEKLQLNNEFN